MDNEIEVQDYTLSDSSGRVVKVATKVIFPNGRELKFLDKLSKSEAIRQSEIVVSKLGLSNFHFSKSA